jgi:hypothetical protein
VRPVLIVVVLVPDAGIGQGGVDCGGEVRAAVADHELDPMRLIAQVHEQVAGLLGGPRPGGMLRDCEDADAPGGAAAAAAGPRADGAGSGSPRSSMPPFRRDSRSHTATRVIRRNTNRKPMIGDHHGRTVRRANLLVRAVDDILGTHGPPAGQLRGEPEPPRRPPRRPESMRFLVL